VFILLIINIHFLYSITHNSILTKKLEINYTNIENFKLKKRDIHRSKIEKLSEYQNNPENDGQYPLLVRYKLNSKKKDGHNVHNSCEVPSEKCKSFIGQVF